MLIFLQLNYFQGYAKETLCDFFYRLGVVQKRFVVYQYTLHSPLFSRMFFSDR